MLELPFFSVVPFVLLLLCIAFLPLAAPHFWEPNRNKLWLSLGLGVPVAAYVWFKALAAGLPLFSSAPGETFNPEHPVFTALHEYVAFMLLLATLYVISGGIYVRGTFAGTPLVNTSLLLCGATLASVLGTTGASMLLLRPLLRANALRRQKVHVVIFFLFLVSNCGGLLTPLGDPPLLLGFLKGVPFTWTLGLIDVWAIVVGALLLIFHLLDSHYFHKDDVQQRSVDLDEEVEKARVPLGIEGGMNCCLLLGVVATIYGFGHYQWRLGVQEGLMLLLALISVCFTPKLIREKNEFHYAPILEVAALFLGIFLTMIPALQILNLRGPELGLEKPWQYFWATGILSSFLDNAPTYLAFAAVGAGTEGISTADPHYLAEYLKTVDGPAILAAISCGAVLMGANTYIGNGPNFMVKAIAESSGVRMPTFFGYMRWSVTILLPLFAAVCWWRFT